MFIFSLEYFSELNDILNRPSNVGQPDDETASQSKSGVAHEIGSEADFDDRVKNAGTKVVLVEFYADWSRPSKDIASFLDTFAEKYAPFITVLKIDVDKHKELAKRYNVDAKWYHTDSKVPTFIFLMNGKSVQRFIGADPTRIEITITALTNEVMSKIISILQNLIPF